MDENMCEVCGKSLLEPTTKGFRKYISVGPIWVTPKRGVDFFWKCPACGHIQGNYFGLERLDKVAQEIMENRLRLMFALSPNDWVTGSVAAEIMGVSFTNLRRGKVEGIATVYRIKIGKDVWWNVESVKRWKKTGNGLFLLPTLKKQLGSVYDGN